ncbi:MAG: hypothetical protein OXU77_21010 [Gammaproteobacteria bacterium]|nr:hypothetical protein [Gammaproteobacteria bacterium]MDE0441991.1 hypothetical protein [Gammaproteobacteria bacterium]
MATVVRSVAITTLPHERRIPRERPSVDDADSRREAGELRELGERVCVEGDAHATVSNVPILRITSVIYPLFLHY